MYVKFNFTICNIKFAFWLEKNILYIATQYIYIFSRCMNNNEFRKISKSKLENWLEAWYINYYNTFTWEIIEPYKQEYYSRSERFQKFTTETHMIKRLSDDYLWKYIRLSTAGRDYKTNRLDEYELDKLFEWKTRQAKSQFVSTCLKTDHLKKIDWRYYFNPYIVNNFWKIKVWSEQDKLYKHFDLGT